MGDNDGWTGGETGGADDYGARSPSPRGRTPPRRSRSRSPVRDKDTVMHSNGRNGDDRGRPADGGSNPGNNLHVSGLSVKVDNRMLEETFGKIGRVQKAQVMYDPHTRESRGFAFVTMESAEEADAAVAQLNATEMLGRPMTIDKARRGRARTPTPGKYFGPPKRQEYNRPYEPRGYERGGYDRYDRGPPPRSYDDYDRYGSRGGYDRDYPPRGGGYREERGPPPDRYSDRYGAPPPRDYPPPRGYDRGPPPPVSRPRYEERPRY